MRVIRSWPVASYFALTIAISWGALILIVGPSSLPLTWEHFERLGPALYGAIIAGPSLACVTVTWLLDGRAGLRALLARLRHWRIGARWYALALVPAAVLAAVSTVLAIVSPAFVPSLLDAEDKLAVVLPVLALSFIIASFEELGWSGFAVPRLRARHGAVATALLIGVVWGAWHFPLFWQRDSFSAPLPLAILLIQLFSWLPGFRLLMVWQQDRSGSLLVPWLMHVSLIAVQLLFQPPAMGGDEQLLALLVTPATVWTMVAVVAIVARSNRRDPRGDRAGDVRTRRRSETTNAQDRSLGRLR